MALRGANNLQLLLVAVGFASFLAMNSFSLWGFSALPQSAFGSQVSNWWIQPLLLSNAATFFVVFLGTRRLPRLFNHGLFPEAVLLLSCGLILLLGFFLTGSLGVLGVASVLVGAGTTCCFFCWEHLLSLGDLRESKRQIVLGSALSVPAFTLLFLFGPGNILFAVSLLALGNLVMLWLAQMNAARMERTEEGASAGENAGDGDIADAGASSGSSGEPGGTGAATVAAGVPSAPAESAAGRPLAGVSGQLGRAALCIVMIGIISPVLGSAANSQELAMIDSYVIVLGANLLSAIVMAFVWFFLKKETSVASVYMVLFPVLITAFLIVPFIGEYRIVILFLGTFSFTLLSIVTMIWCITIARQTGASLVLMYALLGGALYTSRFIGKMLAAIISSSTLSHETQLLASAAILLYGCSLVMFVLARKGFKKLPDDADGQDARDGAASGAAPEPSGVDVLHRASLQLAEERGLSRRQTEVLDLLVHGFDVPSVAKKLFISENTVRTHMKKIYTLLDVHSKQEIIDAVNVRATGSETPGEE